MNKEGFLKVISEVPKIKINSCIAAYNSINVEDLANAVDRFKRIPNYNDLLRENTNLEQALNEIREYANSDKLLKILCEPKINNRGETYYDLIRRDILQIIDKVLGGSDE